MVDLAANYLGLSLRNPLIVSASPLSEDLDNLKRMEEAGASAVVLFSLFEEQIELQEMGYKQYYSQNVNALPDDLQHVAQMSEFKYGAGEYLSHIYRAKSAVDIPIIASLNGYYGGGWTQYARLLEAAGADAIELNIYYIATKPNMTSRDIEEMILGLVGDVKSAVKIPVAVKLSPYFTAVSNMAHALDKAGADGLILFNRFYQPDIEIETQTVTSTLDFSTPQELRLRLRWIALLYGHLQADLAVTGGVHSAEDVIKSVMAGASAAMMTSALYMNGIEHLGLVLANLEAWLVERDVKTLEELRGRLCVFVTGDSAAFERANYMRVIRSTESGEQDLP